MQKEFERSEAQESLLSIVEAFRQMRTVLARQRVGNYLILWGLVDFAGYILTEILRDFGKYEFINFSWMVLIGFGLIGTFVITLKMIKRTRAYFPEGFYIGLIWLSLVLYGLIIWAIIKMGETRLSEIQVSLLWLNFAMLGFVLIGIFLGVEIAVIGVAVSVFSILSAEIGTERLNISMALLCLLAFVGGGLYINKKWDIKK